MSPQRILQIKKAVIELLESEEADNLTEAAEKIGFSKLRLYAWARVDPEWRQLVNEAQEIKADRLEAELDRMNNPVAKIFRLKKLRHEYRDTFHFDVRNVTVEKYLEELKKLGQAQAPVLLPADAQIITIEPIEIQGEKC